MWISSLLDVNQQWQSAPMLATDTIDGIAEPEQDTLGDDAALATDAGQEDEFAPARGILLAAGLGLVLLAMLVLLARWLV